MDYTVSKRPIIEDGIEWTEMVFNYTDADYFSLVPAEKVSEYHIPSIYGFRDDQYWPLEVRTVRARYRGGLYFFTIVRQAMWSFYHPNTKSFGRQIADNVGEYFGDVLFRNSDIYEHRKKMFKFGEYWRDSRIYIEAEYNIENIYIQCFSPSYQSQGYYYKAYTGTCTELKEGTPCPFGNIIEDTSLVDHTKEKSLIQRIAELNKEIISIPEDPYKQNKLKNEIEEILKERKKKLERIDFLKKETTKERYRQEIEQLTTKLKSHPYWPAYAIYEEDKHDAATLKNERLKTKKAKLEEQLREVQSRKFRRLSRACQKECCDCPFYDSYASKTGTKVVCKISSTGLPILEI